MADVEALRHTVAQIIPFNRILAISIASAATDSVELVQPEAPERMNYVGTAHTAASVLFMLGEAAAEAMVLHAFHDLKGKSFLGTRLQCENRVISMS
jgi:hypothetical protein